MPSLDKVARTYDQAHESEPQSLTSKKVADESVTDETQAERHEKHFTSFSSSNSSLKIDDSDPLKQFVRGAGSHTREQSASEFAIEDKQLGRIVTARGERYEPRTSWTVGLKNLVSQDPQDANAEQKLLEYCVSYIDRSLQRLANATQGALQGVTSIAEAIGGDGTASKGGAHYTTDLVGELAQKGGTADVALVADNPLAKNPARATDGSYSSSNPHKALDAQIAAILKEVASWPKTHTESPTRKPDIAYHTGIDTNAPLDVVAVGGHGIPGHFHEAKGWLQIEMGPEVSADKLKRDILARYATNNPPLAIIVACHSGDSTSDSSSVAAQIARKSKMWVLGSQGNVDRTTTYTFDRDCLHPNPKGRGYVLFDPAGRRVPYDFNNPITVEDWNVARKLSRLKLSE